MTSTATLIENYRDQLDSATKPRREVADQISGTIISRHLTRSERETLDALRIHALDTNS